MVQNSTESYYELQQSTQDSKHKLMYGISSLNFYDLYSLLNYISKWTCPMDSCQTDND